MKMREKKCRVARLIVGFCLFVSVVCGFGVQRVSATQLQEEQELDYILGRPMTEEEIQQQKALEPELQQTVIEEDEIVPSVGEGTQEARAVPLPASYDSRTLGLVTPVKNQGKWGACWSHAVVACAESSLLSKEMITMEQADLSELHLAYFLYHTPQDPLGNAIDDKTISQGDLNYLERGGNARMAVFPLANFVGFADEATAPYNEREMPEDLDESVAYADTAHLKDAYWLAPSDIAQIKTVLMELGAASVSVYMDTDNYYNYDTGAYYCDLAESATNHAVTIIGWNDGYAAENFNSTCRPMADGAWLVKNSWGEGWGEGGYFWLSYEDALINKSNFSFFDAEVAKEGQKNYHYDGSASTSTVSLGNGGGIANIYHASASETGAEKIDAVGFVLGTPNVQYEVQIYKNVTDKKDPQSGIPVLKTPQKGTLDYCGYHTIPLKETVTVGKNETFAIVVTTTQESGEGISHYVDYSQEFKNSKGEVWCKTETSEFPEQSFYKNGPKNRWVDASNGKFTMRLKGLTLPAKPVSVSSVSVKPKSMKLVLSEKKRIEAALSPIDATDYSLTWTSSDQKIAKVDASGMVTAISPGKCEITATSANGKQASCTVNVWELKKVTGMKVVKATTSSIQFKWTKQAGASGYQLQRYNYEKEVWEVLGYLEGENCNSYIDKKLKSGTEYSYRVNAYVKADGNYLFGDFSDYFKARTADKKPKTPVLSKVSNVSSGISVKWKKVSNADGYYLYRKANGGKWKKITSVSGASSTSFTDQSVKNKNESVYSYSVAAYRGSAVSSYNKTGKKMVRLSTPKLSKPICKSLRSMSVTWDQNKKADGYQIQYALKRNFKKAKDVNMKSGKTVKKTLKNLQKKKTYYVRIRSLKNSGGKKYYSAWSAVQSVKLK